MMSATLIETSISISLIKKGWRRYCSIERRCDGIYKDSRMHRLAKEFWKKIGVCFRYSFLGRISEIGEEGNPQVLNGSKVARWLIGLYKKCEQSFVFYSSTSKVTGSLGQVKEEFYILPVRTVGIVVAVSILLNIFLSIILQKEIGIWGWTVRGLFLFVGLGGLFCDIGWEDTKKTSIVLRKMK